jgi:hypothetical protein
VYPRSADAETEAVVAMTTTEVEAAAREGVALVRGWVGPHHFILINYSAVVLFAALPILFIFKLRLPFSYCLTDLYL